ncbi:hypothetical protein F4806DRAFT_84651 [Annulohypoxylon nitens]|nr:hypothetical protein F4806DRAFT_84651 [Annulohypoxylon nitens]
MSILSIKEYDRTGLETFLEAEHDQAMNQWQTYLTNLSNGTTPFALRGVMKDAWQILSEELGDGDVSRNHVYVYRELLRSAGINLPDPDTPAFVREELGMDDIDVWRAAVSQLMISLFPDEFLPEMLGFNLHFEQLTLETIQAAHRLPELGMSGYYFILHVCIDNAHSGHAAMAQGIVSRYLDIIYSLSGKQAVEETWRRIQAGYVLSKQVGSHGDDGRDTTSLFPPFSEQESGIARMFKRKARVSHLLHCSSRAKIGGQSLEAWLSPSNWESPYGQARLLDALSRATPWIRKGNSDCSLLVRELSWGGKMFGAFTDKEVEQVKDWINSLGTPNNADNETYWSMLGIFGTARPRSKDLLYQEPEVFSLPSPGLAAKTFVQRPALTAPSSGVCLASLLPLWFGHACLFQGMVTVPYRIISPLGNLVVRLLRTEYGFAPEPEGVEGIDEHSPYGLGLIDLGLEISQKSQNIHIELLEKQQESLPQCLGDVLSPNPLDNDDLGVRARTFAGKMLQWSRLPVANEAALLGLARAFLGLEVWVASAQGLLSEEARQALGDIVERKTTLLDACVEEIREDEGKLAKFIVGYELGHNEIKHCFEDA